MSLFHFDPSSSPTTKAFDLYIGCADLLSRLEHATKGSSEPYLEAFCCIFKHERLRLKKWALKTGVDSNHLQQDLNVQAITDTLHNYSQDLVQLNDSLMNMGKVEDNPLGWPESNMALRCRSTNVSAWNDCLMKILPSGLREEVSNETRLLRLSSIAKAKSLEQLEVLHLISSINVDDQLKLASEFKRLSLGLEMRRALKEKDLVGKSTPSIPVAPAYAPPIRSSDVSNLEPFDDEKDMIDKGRKVRRYLVKYRNVSQKVLLEYKYYSAETTKGNEIDVIFDRMHNLAALLHAGKPPSLRVLDCMGVFEEPQNFRFGLVHRVPSNTHLHYGPRTLLYLLNSKWTPSLTDRIALARSLANCILELHSVGWLHKSFRSENILFFVKQNSTKRTLESPYLVGFEFSRPDCMENISEKIPPDPEADMYRHPDCQREPTNRFNRIYEYYSLGIVLFEIARWRSIRHVLDSRLRINNLTRTADIQEIRSMLLDLDSKETYPKDIEFRMGNIYKSVTYKCLEGSFHVDPQDDDKLLEAFYEEVVKPLQACVI